MAQQQQQQVQLLAAQKAAKAKAAAKELAAQKAVQLKMQISKLELLNINFPTNVYHITDDAQSKINQYDSFLKMHTNYNIIVNGYTDSVGKSTYNLRLSQKRADTVAKDIVSHGIDAKRVTAIGYGEAYPVASNATKQGRAQNRRVDVKLILSK